MYDARVMVVRVAGVSHAGSAHVRVLTKRASGEAPFTPESAAVAAKACIADVRVRQSFTVYSPVMDDEMVSLAHRLFVLAGGFGSASVSIAMFAGVLHGDTSSDSPRTPREDLANFADALEGGVDALRRLLAELDGLMADRPRP